MPAVPFEDEQPMPTTTLLLNNRTERSPYFAPFEQKNQLNLPHNEEERQHRI